MSVSIPQHLAPADQKWSLIKTKADAARAAAAIRFLRRHGIEPLLIKGIACARYYPPDSPRQFMDVDLAVSPSDYPRAAALIAADEGKHLIDLHCGLRDLDTASWESVSGLAVEIQIEGEMVRIPAPADHLRLLVAHWLLDGGRYKHRLWDFYYLVDQERDTMDWHRVLDPLPKNRRRWIECVMGCAALYLKLDLKGTPFAGADQRLPAWFVSTLEREREQPDLRAVYLSAGDRRQLAEQLRRRLAPNPITATVMMNGSFDAPTRFFYRVGNVLQRLPASLRNLAHTFVSRPR